MADADDGRKRHDEDAAAGRGEAPARASYPAGSGELPGPDPAAFEQQGVAEALRDAEAGATSYEDFASEVGTAGVLHPMGEVDDETTQIAGQLRRAAGIVSVVAIVLGALALVGWFTGEMHLTAYVTGQPRMQPNTAVAVIVTGAGILLALGGRRRLGGALGFLPLLLGVLTLAQYALGRGLGIDQLLLADPIVAYRSDFPGRPSPQSAIAFVTLGAALVASMWSARVSQIFAFFGLLVPYIALIGLLFEAGLLYRLDSYIGVSLPTALSLILLGVAVLCLTPGRAYTALLTADRSGGRLARRLLPWVFVLPPVWGMLRIYGQNLGLYGVPTGIALMVLALTGSVVSLIVLNARSLNALESSRLQIFELLREFELMVRSVVDYAIFMIDTEGRIKTWNKGAERIYGYRAAEVIGRPLEMVYLPEARAERKLQRLMHLATTHDHIEDFGYRIRKGGERFWADVVFTALRDSDGQVVGFSKVTRDISERKRVQDALHNSEERYRRLVELSPEAIVVDRNGKLIFANSASVDLFGVSGLDDLLGRSIYDFVQEGDVDDYRRRLAEITQQRADFVLFEQRLMRLNGTAIDAETRASVIDFQGGPAVLSIIRDISQRKRSMMAVARKTSELRQAEEMARFKDQVISNISHEMRTPLTQILGFGELLADRYPEDELLPGMLDGAERLTQQIERIIDFIALSGGRLSLYVTETLVSDALKHAVSLERAELDAHHLTVALDVEPSYLVVMADYKRLVQIVRELLNNAKKNAPEGSTITLRAWEDLTEPAVKIAVTDSGPGIPEAARRGIFEAFEQLEVGDALRKGGIGIGLALVKMLTELHQGRVEVASEPGAGTTFTVSLPQN